MILIYNINQLVNFKEVFKLNYNFIYLENQTAYMLYSATAEDGLTDSPNNLNSINNEVALFL